MGVLRMAGRRRGPDTLRGSFDRAPPRPTPLSPALRKVGEVGGMRGRRPGETSGDGLQTAVAGREGIYAVGSTRRIAASAGRVLEIGHADLERQHRGSRARPLREDAGA